MTERTNGPLQALLGNAVSDAIMYALKAGMEVDEAACIAALVAADYARAEYGDTYLGRLADVVRSRGDEPMPEVVYV